MLASFLKSLTAWLACPAPPPTPTKNSRPPLWRSLTKSSVIVSIDGMSNCSIIRDASCRYCLAYKFFIFLLHMPRKLILLLESDHTPKNVLFTTPPGFRTAEFLRENLRHWTHTALPWQFGFLRSMSPCEVSELRCQSHKVRLRTVQC